MRPFGAVFLQMRQKCNGLKRLAETLKESSKKVNQPKAGNTKPATNTITLKKRFIPFPLIHVRVSANHKFKITARASAGRMAAAGWLMSHTPWKIAVGAHCQHVVLVKQQPTWYGRRQPHIQISLWPSPHKYVPFHRPRSRRSCVCGGSLASSGRRALLVRRQTLISRKNSHMH